MVNGFADEILWIRDNWEGEYYILIFFLDKVLHIVIIINYPLKRWFYQPSLHVKGCRTGGAEFHKAHADTGHSKIFYAELKPFSTVINIQTLKSYDRNLNPPEGPKRLPGFFLVFILFNLHMPQFSLGFNTVTMTVN